MKLLARRLGAFLLALTLASAAFGQLAMTGGGKATAGAAAGPCSGSFQLCDAFSGASKDTAKWTSTTILPGWEATATIGGSDTEGLGVVIASPTISTNAMQGRSSVLTNITLVNREMVFSMPVAPNTTGAVSFGYSQTTGRSGQNIRWLIDNNFGSLSIQASFSNFGSGGTQFNAAYSSTDHYWFRIRVTGSDVFWETAPNNAGVPGTWVVRRQLTVDGGTPGTYFAPNGGDVGMWTHNYNSNATPLVPQWSDFWVTN